MKRYIFERVNREEVVAESEEEARSELSRNGYLEDEFTLLDVRDDG